MGFGENFKILVSDSEAYKQFGNSVATAVIKAITQNIYNILEPKNLCQTQNTQQILAQQLLEMAF
jgi:DNA (cytosine-5)-methyltransferase 1